MGRVLLERQLYRRKTTGEVPAERWLQFSWPPRWHYDVLRSVECFRRTGAAPDERVAEAVRLVRDKRKRHVGLGYGYGTQVKRPLRLAIVDDYAVVVAGVASFLAEQRIDVVETGTSLPVISDVDVVLYDTFGQVQGEGIDLQDYVRESGAKVVIYSWNLRPDLIEQAIAGGASGYLSKVLTGPAIVQALERIMNGEIVILAGDHETSEGGAGDWPGRSAGLSPREAEIVALIARGLSNQEIAERAFLSTNTIKSYIRTAYRKMGVERRTQAVLWAMKNDFGVETERTLDPALRLPPAVPARSVPLP